MKMQNQQNEVLQALRDHENKIKTYQQKEIDKKIIKGEIPYQVLSYKVKNPFRGI
jgi:hypothetical protein